MPYMPCWRICICGRGITQRCIDYCDLIIDYKKGQYDELLQEYSSFVRNVELYGDFPLISEAPNGSSYAGTSFSENFLGKGNSFESISN